MHALLVAALLLGAGEEMELALEAGGQVKVTIQTLPDAAKKHGADVTAIQTQAEAALRRCGVPVAASAGGSSLNIALNALSAKGGFAANLFSSAYRIEEVRDRLVVVLIWESNMIMTGPPGALASQTREALAQQLDEFCNEYLKAKQGTKGSRKR